MEKILIIAGEHSGEKYGAQIVKHLKMYLKKSKFWGSGGKLMENEGVMLLENIENLSAIGPVEALKLLGNYLKLILKILKIIKREKIKTAILIDFPDFNLFLAPFLKKRGVKVIYFISPTIWIWRYKRVKKIKKYVDLMLSIFPNEREIFEKENVKSIFVGHPLKEEVDKTEKINLAKIFNLHEDMLPVAILPGSRKREIDFILEEILKGLKKIKKRHPEIFFVIPIANSFLKNDIIKKIEEIEVKDLFLTEMKASKVLKSSHMAIVKSGTSTLEATFSQIPFFIVYKTSTPTYLIGKLLLRVKHIGMVNLIAGENVIPELIQGNLNGEKILETFETIFSDKEVYEKIKNKLKEISELFGKKKTFEEISKAIYREIEKSHSPRRHLE